MSALKSLFKKKASHQEELPGAPSDATNSTAHTAVAFNATAAHKKTWFSRLRPGAKRDAQIANLQVGYCELIELIRSVRTQLEKQSDFDEKLAGTLDHVPVAVEGLNRISEHTEQQGKVLKTLQDQIKSSAENDREFIHGIHRFNETLSTMEESSKRSTDTMLGLFESTQKSEAMMRTLLERSEKRFIIMVSTLSMAALVLIGTTIYFALFSNSSSTPNISEPSVQKSLDEVIIGSENHEEVVEPVLVEAENEQEDSLSVTSEDESVLTDGDTDETISYVPVDINEEVSIEEDPEVIGIFTDE